MEGWEDWSSRRVFEFSGCVGQWGEAVPSVGVSGLRVTMSVWACLCGLCFMAAEWDHLAAGVMEMGEIL